jgi:hypothetical protein
LQQKVETGKREGFYQRTASALEFLDG